MPEKVPYNTIDERVVSEWKEIIEEKAREKGHKLGIIQPIHPYEQTYNEILEEVAKKTHQGLEFYRIMVHQLPWFEFENSNEKEAG